ncbi:hypothetical protein J7L65_06240 [Candidatus Bathyarchaeota archaeon]|nr:hypothetical protein [Candidatus Bathyarchaeota archaeon]
MRLWPWVIAFAIVASVAFLIEFYGSRLYPVTSYEAEVLPPLEVGMRHRFDIYKDEQLVGHYTFWIVDVEERDGCRVYVTRSRTTALYKGLNITIDTLYIFDELLNPIEYRLNATLGEEHQRILCLFNDSMVNASLWTKDQMMSREVKLSDDTVLIDTNMAGQWELFFNSFEFTPGRRVRFTMFIPQLMEKAKIDVILDRGRESINIGGVDYSCLVARAPDLNLIFYLYEGRLLKLEQTRDNFEFIASAEAPEGEG